MARILLPTVHVSHSWAGMPHSSLSGLDPFIAAASDCLASALRGLRSFLLSVSLPRGDGLGWLWLVPTVLLLRVLLRRPALFAVVILVAIEAGAATTVARTYTTHVERLFAKLGPPGR